MMHFPLFQISPYSRKKFRTPWKIFRFDLYPKKFFDFHPPKFLMTFFSHLQVNLNFPPIFAISLHFPHISGKSYFPPIFFKFPSDFVKVTWFLHTLCVFPFPPNLTMMHDHTAIL